MDARPVLVEDERRAAVGRRLDREREDRERRDPPLAEARRKHERDHPDDDREDDTAGGDRPDQGRLGPAWRPMRREPGVDVPVRVSR